MNVTTDTQGKVTYSGTFIRVDASGREFQVTVHGISYEDLRRYLVGSQSTRDMTPDRVVRGYQKVRLEDLR